MERQIDTSGMQQGVSGTNAVTYAPAPNSAEAHDIVYRFVLPERATVTWLVERGIARRTAYRLVSHPTRVDLATLSKLCEILNCTPDDLIVNMRAYSPRRTLCAGCDGELTQADREGGQCSQCGKGLK